VHILRSCATAHKVRGMTSAYETGAVPPVLLRHRLRIAREFAGLEQEELAALMGVSRKTVGNTETGRVKPRPITLRAWAFHCGVPLAWIEDGGAEPHPPGGDLETGATSPLDPQIVEIPRRARVLVVDDDGTLNEEATRQLTPLTQPGKHVTLRLTADYATDCATGDYDVTLSHRAWWLPSLEPVAA
jgi:transcriptional regulator with XRE-family HTH domain